MVKLKSMGNTSSTTAQGLLIAPASGIGGSSCDASGVAIPRGGVGSPALPLKEDRAQDILNWVLAANRQKEAALKREAAYNKSLSNESSSLAQGQLIAPAATGDSSRAVSWAGLPGGAMGPPAPSLEPERTQDRLMTQELPWILEAIQQMEAQEDKASVSTLSRYGEAIAQSSGSNLSHIDSESSSSKKHKLGETELPESSKCTKVSKEDGIIDRTFSCLVCQESMRHPVITSCCRSLVACKQCSTAWSSTNNSCLKCRAPNPVYTEVLGLDEGISALKSKGLLD